MAEESKTYANHVDNYPDMFDIPTDNSIWKALIHIPFSDTLCISGGFALRTLMDVSPDMAAPTWISGDCDVFICGGTIGEFRDRVQAIQDTISDKTSCDIIRIADGQSIIDMKITSDSTSVLTPLSFIHHDITHLTSDIVKTFDMDICSVLMSVVHDSDGKCKISFEVADDVRNSIVSRMATAYKMRTSMINEPVYRSHRVNKYKMRGFHVSYSDQVIDSVYMIDYFMFPDTVKCPIPITTL